MSWRCQDNSLVGISGRKARVSALRCRRWSCPQCAPRLRRKMIALALAGFESGERVRMMTLTSPGDEDYEYSYDQLRPRWKRLREMLRRRFPRIRLDYFAVIERQRRGHAHLHVLFRGGYIPQRWLKHAAVQAGFGSIVDVREVGKAAGRYVAKYLGKEMGAVPEALGFPPLPKWHRRATWSRNWATAFAKRRLAWLVDNAVDAYRWYIANCRPVLMVDRLRLLGYTVDPIDYGDISPLEQDWERHRQEPVQVILAGSLPCRCELCRSDDLGVRRHPALWSATPRPPMSSLPVATDL